MMKRVKNTSAPLPKTTQHRILVFLRQHPMGVSGISAILCISLLIGVTLALFSDTIRNTNNRIQTGNLKIGFELSDQLTGENDLDTTSPNYRNLKETSDAAIFAGNSQYWKPGDHGTKYFKITNSGTMPLNYQMSFQVSDGGLGQAITFTITKITSTGEISGIEGDHSVSGTNLGNVTLSHNNMPSAQEFDLYRVDYILSDSLDNTYNTETPAYFNMDVTLNAQQITDDNQI